MHDANDGSIESVLRKRFQETHVIEKMVYQSRTLDDLVPLAGKWMSPRSKLSLVDERRRYGLSWLLLTRRLTNS